MPVYLASSWANGYALFFSFVLVAGLGLSLDIYMRRSK